MFFRKIELLLHHRSTKAEIKRKMNSNILKNVLESIHNGDSVMFRTGTAVNDLPMIGIMIGRGQYKRQHAIMVLVGMDEYFVTENQIVS